MPIAEAQARRALRHADIRSDREVDDPRESAWVVHDHEGLLGGLAAAFAGDDRRGPRADDRRVRGLTIAACAGVATDVEGSHFHRHHRCPGAHPVARRQTTTRTAQEFSPACLG